MRMIDNNDDDFFEDMEDELDECPLLHEILYNHLLGSTWSLDDNDLICDFLKELGYKIIERKDYIVVVKPDSSEIPDYCNIFDVFQKEVKKLSLNILLKYGR